MSVINYRHHAILESDASRQLTEVRRTFLIPQDVRNPEPVQGCLLECDNSKSTDDNGALNQTNAALAQFAEQACHDRRLAGSLVVGASKFGTFKPFEMFSPFAPASEFAPQQLVAQGLTPHCQHVISGIEVAIQFQAYVQKILQRDVRWFVIINTTDGNPTDLEYQPLAVEASTVIAMEHRIQCFYIGAGEPNMHYLKTLAQPGRPPIYLPDVRDFRVFFEWLWKSLRRSSVSQSGDILELDGPFGEKMRWDV